MRDSIKVFPETHDIIAETHDIIVSPAMNDVMCFWGYYYYVMDLGGYH